MPEHGGDLFHLVISQAQEVFHPTHAYWQHNRIPRRLHNLTALLYSRMAVLLVP